jgi:thiol-disulfide isomerase/thioredoxin
MEGDRKSIFKKSEFLLVFLILAAAIVIVSLIVILAFSWWSQFQITNNPVVVRGTPTFMVKEGAEICRENGLPVVYLFSTTACPHCRWIKDTFDNAVKGYVAAGKIKAYHYELDSGDDTLTAEKEVVLPASAMQIYQEFSPQRNIPIFVFGCKYSRIGNGYEYPRNLDAESQEFKNVINELLK